MLQTSPPSNDTGLAEFFRFALLLTGRASTAEHLLAATLAEGEAHVGQVRRASGRKAWMVQRIRERCLNNHESAPPAATPEPASAPPLVLTGEPSLLARRFHSLPEPERSALALFYLDFFTAEEIAEVLKMSVETLSETLAAARRLLGLALRAAPDAEADES